AWINGRPVTMAQLAGLTAHLVEIHGQHEHQALMARGSQMALLDAYAGTAPQRQSVAEAARYWSTLSRERDELQAQGDVSDRIEWIEHQFLELERETLDADSIAQLLLDHRRQAHASDLIAASDRAFDQLGGSEDASVSRALQQVRHELQRVATHEPRLVEVDGMLAAAAIQIDEAGSLLDRIRDDLDIDPSLFESIEQRLARLHDLARKHRVAPEELGAHRDALERELDTRRGADRRLEKLDHDIQLARVAWRKAADALGAKRRKAATRLAGDTTALIGELGMGGGHFGIDFEPLGDDRPDPNGGERIEFMVAANPGQPPRPLRKVASGGELSRISLAIEVAALGLDAVPTMVFDEVDSGIGGAVA